MKTKRLNIAIALLAVALIGTSCGNKQQKSSSDTTTEKRIRSDYRTVCIFRLGN